MTNHHRPGLRGLVAAVCACALTFGIAACSSDSTEQNSSTAAEKSSKDDGEWPRTISTEDGELALDKKPERIVSTATTLTGGLLSLGAPVIASGATAPNNPGFSDGQGFFSQWSKEAKDADVAKLWGELRP